MGIGVLGLAALSWFPAALLFAGMAGFGYLSSNAGATTQLQLGVDETQRGRIMAIWSVAFLGVRPIASLIDGAIAGVAGVRVAAAVMALPAFFVALGLWIGSRRRTRDHRHGLPPPERATCIVSHDGKARVRQLDSR